MNGENLFGYGGLDQSGLDVEHAVTEPAAVLDLSDFAVVDHRAWSRETAASIRVVNAAARA